MADDDGVYIEWTDGKLRGPFSEKEAERLAEHWLHFPEDVPPPPYVPAETDDPFIADPLTEREWDQIRILLIDLAPEEPAKMKAWFKELDDQIASLKADLTEWLTIPLTAGWD